MERLEGRDLLASFVGLGPGTDVAAVSADGSVVFGVNGVESSARGFLWTAAGGFAYLPTAVQPFGIYGNGSRGAISADGSKVAGLTRASGIIRVASWSAATGLVDLGIAPGSAYSEANGISADGKYVVGSRSDPTDLFNSHAQAYIWNTNGGATAVTSGYYESRAIGISGDGEYVVGVAKTSAQTQNFAYRWSVATGILDLGFVGSAFATTADGSTVVGERVTGNQANASRILPVVWNLNTGAVDLGLPAGTTDAEPFDISTDGKLIVGTARNSAQAIEQATAWGADRQPMAIKDLLQNQYRLDLAGWKLTEAWAVSADGTTIIGTGINPDGKREAWVARLDNPALPPNLVATKLEFATDGSGVRYAGELRDASLTTSATIGLYWAKFDAFGRASSVGPAISTTSITQIGATSDVFVPRASFASPPVGATALMVIADPANVIGEVNESDNTRVLGVANIVPQLGWNTLLNGGQARYRIFNGNVASPTELRIYWASGPNRGDILGSPIKTQVVQGAGDGNAIPLTATDLGSPPVGAKYLVAIADPNNTVIETDESDNVAALAVPDLLPTSLAFDAQGNAVYSGRVATTSTPLFSSYLELYYASGPNLADVTQLIDRHSMATVGDYGTFTVSASLLASRPVGAKYLVAVADQARMVIESDETNNVVSIALPPLELLNIPPVVVLAAKEVVATAGTAVPITGWFADLTSSSWSATFDPGDGSGPAPLALNADHSFSKTVSYAVPGTYILNASVTDNGGLKGSASVLVRVAAAVPQPARLITSVATLKKMNFTGLNLAFDRAIGKLSGVTITLVQAGRDGRFGTKDDVKIVLKAPTTTGVTLGLSLKKAAKLAKVARLTVTGLRAADGQFVDANGDGVPDASWSRTLTPNKQGTSISIS